MKLIKLLMVSVFIFGIINLNGCSDRNSYNGKLIYESGNDLLEAQGIIVKQVSKILETPNSLIVEVHYHYDNKVPSEQVKLSVQPDMPYAESSLGAVEKGEDRATQVIINTHSSSMINKGLSSAESSVLTISFDQYDNQKKINTIYSLPIIYKKNWSPKK